MQDPLRTPSLAKNMPEKPSLNFQVYALRDIEAMVREGFRVAQKMSFC